MSKGFPVGDGSVKLQRFIHKMKADKLLVHLEDTDHEDYFMNDRELAKKYKMKAVMIKNIRTAGGVPIKEDRIIRILRTIPTRNMFMVDIVKALDNNIPYNTLYVLMRNNKIPFLRVNKIADND